jgi:hypothetical protein
VRDILQRTSGGNPYFTQSPEAVAKTAVKKLFTKQFRIVPGFHNRVLLGISRVLPGFITDKILVDMFKPKPVVKPKLTIVSNKIDARWEAIILVNR